MVLFPLVLSLEEGFSSFLSLILPLLDTPHPHHSLPWQSLVLVTQEVRVRKAVQTDQRRRLQSMEDAFGKTASPLCLSFSNSFSKEGPQQPLWLQSDSQ